MGSSNVEFERLLQAARAHLAQNQLHEAVSEATAAIRLSSKAPGGYVIRAEAHRRLKQLERSLADLAVAIRLDPQQPAPYVIRAELLKKRNVFDGAIADATFALTLDPRNAAAFSVRAECRNAIGDQEGANEDLQEMLAIDPTRPVPNLQAKVPSGEPTPKLASDDERFWKEAGGRVTEDRSLFADGKSVDKTYRARQIVSDEEAPEALGVASGYKPEIISKPLPRMRERSKRSVSNVGGAVLLIGVAIVAGCALWMVFRSVFGPETNPKAPSPQPVTIVRNAGEVIPAPSDAAPNLSLTSTPSVASDSQRSVEGNRDDLSVRQPVVVLEKSGDQLPPLPQGKRWQMVWHDEFDGTTLDAAKWTPTQEMKRKGGWWKPKAVMLDGHGHLVIKTYKDGDRYIDGCASSEGKFEHTFGYCVARLRFQRAPGHWSGFWMFSPGVFKVGNGGRDGVVFQPKWHIG
jgi:flagellin-like protein